MVFTPHPINNTITNPDTLWDAWSKVNTDVQAIRDDLVNLESEMTPEIETIDGGTVL